MVKTFALNARLLLFLLLGLLGGIVYLFSNAWLNWSRPAAPAPHEEPNLTVLDCGPKIERGDLSTLASQTPGENPNCLFIGCGGFF